MKYVSGAYVNKDGWMHPINDKRILSVLIQTPIKGMYDVELEFFRTGISKAFSAD